MSAQAESLLRQIQELDAHITRLLGQAQGLQRQMREAKDRRAETEGVAA